MVRRAGRSRLRRKEGAIETPYTTPPESPVVVRLDEMGPESAKNFPGQKLAHAEPRQTADGQTRPAERAKQEVDYRRRGYVFGASRPAPGEALRTSWSGSTPRPPPTWGSSTRCWKPPGAPGHRRFIVRVVAPAVGVRDPAEVRGAPQPNRAVVEGAEVAGAEGAAVRDVGRRVPRHRGGDGPLEQASPPVRLGPETTPPVAATAGSRRRSECEMTCQMHYLGRPPGPFRPPDLVGTE